MRFSELGDEVRGFFEAFAEVKCIAESEGLQIRLKLWPKALKGSGYFVSGLGNLLSGARREHHQHPEHNEGPPSEPPASSMYFLPSLATAFGDE